MTNFHKLNNAAPPFTFPKMQPLAARDMRRRDCERSRAIDACVGGECCKNCELFTAPGRLDDKADERDSAYLNRITKR